MKQKETGVSHEERMAAVTDAWRRSDSAKAFVAALEDLGYVLARGRNETRVVLVDFYGHTTALTRLIDDPSVRAKHVREFLGAAFAPDKLPTVEQAQEQAAQRRAMIEAFESRPDASREQAGALVRQQAARRGEAGSAGGASSPAAARRARAARSHAQGARAQLKASYLAAQRRIRIERARRKPRGLAAFLGRVSGVALMIRKVQRYRDRKRYAAYLVWRGRAEAPARRKRARRSPASMRYRWRISGDGLRALDQIEQRERESLGQARRRERRQRMNARHEHMPVVGLIVMPPHQSTGSTTASETAIARQMAEAAQLLKEGREPVHLSGAFAQASGVEEGEGDSGDTGTVEPSRKRSRKKRVRRRSALRREFRQAASGDQGDGDGGDESSEAPKSAAEPRRKRRRPKKRKSGDGPVTAGGQGKLNPEPKPGGGEERKSDRQQRRPRQNFSRGV